MEKGKVKDFLSASRDEAVNAVVESDMLPTAVGEIAKGAGNSY